MDVGLHMFWSADGWPAHSDRDVYEEELRIALLAEELGFDVVWSAEHHFFDYSFCPDAITALAYIAGKTTTIELGTAAVIVPWNNPLAVAERLSMVDMLSGGRLRVGLGRGLSQREFALFGEVEMEESRERFDEGAQMIAEALRTGYIEGKGPYYEQPYAEIRPRSSRDFDDRLYAVASSADSIDAAARLRARMCMFADRSWEHRLPSVERYRSKFREFHGFDAPPPMTSDACLCLADGNEATELAQRHYAVHLAGLLEHYDVMGREFENIKGYAAYAKAAESLRAMGERGFLDSFLRASSWGTPDDILKTLEQRRQLLGPCEFATSFRFGGLPIEKAEESMRLFASEVLPVLKTWDA